MDINQKGILLVVSGPSGCGKGTVLSHILRDKENYSLSVSFTTRAPRPGEIDGVHYGFVSKNDFLKQIEAGNMLEFTEYCGNYYGTPQSTVNSLLEKGVNVVLEIETVGAMNVKNIRSDAVLVMILPPSYEVLENRLRSRGTNSEEDIAKRLLRAKEELKALPEYHYCVINHEGRSHEAAEQIRRIVEAEKHKIERNNMILNHFYQ